MKKAFAAGFLAPNGGDAVNSGFVDEGIKVNGRLGDELLLGYAESFGWT